MANLSIQNLDKFYGDNHVVKDINVNVNNGEFIVLLGPSGCGKTTILRMVSGFIIPSSGAIYIGDKDITTLPPWKRNCGLVFQNYALFPHMTVAQNVAFGLEMLKIPKSEHADRVNEALSMVRLNGMHDRYPRQMSGGQQQRVAIARALITKPDVLLLDEPLSNLDAKLRQEVRIEIRELQQRLQLTAIMVTHDQEEALSMADKLVIMNGGEIRQFGTQVDLYENPADRFVAGFIGKMSFIEGDIYRDGQFKSQGGLDILCEHSYIPGKGCIALRSEHITVGSEAINKDNHFSASVEFIEYLGAFFEVRVLLNGKDRLTLQLPNNPSSPRPQIGDQFELGWNKQNGFVYRE